jgi:hypothetical protein
MNKTMNNPLTVGESIDFLDKNLSVENSIVPKVTNIREGLSKGIYFWFLNPRGYESLSKFIKISSIDNCFQYSIDNIEHDLVYIGTAGTGRNGLNNISKRLRWHIGQRHSENEVRYGTLSTLRSGVSSLLSNDLIESNTEKLVNDFFGEHMRVFWIGYPDDRELIDNNERTLIRELKPLLNIKNNPSALDSAGENITQMYKRHRQEVIRNTRGRLGL